MPIRQEITKNQSITTGSSKPLNDRRLSKRVPTHDISELVVNFEGRTITCLVHNISDTGALLETSGLQLPKRFVLDNPHKIFEFPTVQFGVAAGWLVLNFSGQGKNPDGGNRPITASAGICRETQSRYAFAMLVDVHHKKGELS